MADGLYALSGTSSLPTIRKTCSEEKKRSNAEQKSVTGINTFIAMRSITGFNVTYTSLWLLYALQSLQMFEKGAAM